MPEKYFALSDIKKDLEWLKSAGCTEISPQEMLERFAYESIEPADVMPVVRGTWIVRQISRTDIVAYCSNCKKQAPDASRVWHENGVVTIEHKPVLTDFCPHCAAFMNREE